MPRNPEAGIPRLRGRASDCGHERSNSPLWHGYPEDVFLLLSQSIELAAFQNRQLEEVVVPFGKRGHDDRSPYPKIVRFFDYDPWNRFGPRQNEIQSGSRNLTGIFGTSCGFDRSVIVRTPSPDVPKRPSTAI